MPQATKALTAGQFLLTTLVVKVAIVAVLSTMLVRFPWFRRILLTEKRDWPERLVFAASLGASVDRGRRGAAAHQLRRRRPDAGGRLPGGTAGGSVCRRHRWCRSSAFPRSSRASSSRCHSRLDADLLAAACARSARKKPSGTSRRCSSPICTGTSGASSDGFKSTGWSFCWQHRSALKSSARRSADNFGEDRIFYLAPPNPWLGRARRACNGAMRRDPDQDLEQRADRAPARRSRRNF